MRKVLRGEIDGLKEKIKQIKKEKFSRWGKNKAQVVKHHQDRDRKISNIQKKITRLQVRLKKKSKAPDKLLKSLVINSQINNLKIALDQHRYIEINGKMIPSPDNKDWAEQISASFLDDENSDSKYMTLNKAYEFIENMGKIIIMLDENRSQIGKYNTIFSKRLHLGVYAAEELPNLSLRETFPEQYMNKALDLDAIYNQAVKKVCKRTINKINLSSRSYQTYKNSASYSLDNW